MAQCPNGHDSASDDFCDVCGMRIGGSPATGPSPAVSAPPRPDTAAETCPRCGTPRTGQFCEACGFNFNGPRFIPAGPPPPASAGPPPPSPASSLPPASASSPSMSSFPYPQATWTAVAARTARITSGCRHSPDRKAPP